MSNFIKNPGKGKLDGKETKRQQQHLFALIPDMGK